MKKYLTVSFVSVLILAACSTTKNIPEGSYLLDGIEIKHDTKNATSDLEGYVRQQPNSSFLFFGKVRLKIYNMAGQDTSKWITRTVRKMGQAPVLYSTTQASTSRRQLIKQLQNQGYLNAYGDTLLRNNEKNQKIKVTYELHGGDPYKIRNYIYAFSDTTIARIMGRFPSNRLVNPGDYFDKDMIEEEKSRVNEIMRNVGYYDFSKDYVYFKADTTLNSHAVDLFMDVYPKRDSLPYRRYKINDVTIISGLNSSNNISQSGNRINTNRWFFRNADTTYYNNLTIIRGRNDFLRTTTINRNNYLRKGNYYSDFMLNYTYQAYSKMGAIKQVNITTEKNARDSTLLDATIILMPANVHSFKAGLDGTNSAGDLGIAPSISYQHQNLFNGGEQLSIKLKGAYEFITGNEEGDLLNDSYYEYGIETSLTFPMFLFPWLKKSWRERPSASTRISIGLNNQHRPEYTRQFFNAAINYNWSAYRNRLQHSLDFQDINYILMPWVSQRFDSLYLNNNDDPLLQESYRDQLVSRTAYSVTLTNGRRIDPLYPTYTLRGSIEIAGVVPRLITTLNGADPDENGQKQILGVAYAEYVKGSVEYARTFYFSKKHSLAYRTVLGLAYPYGNSSVLPYERRFFAGGANSIRGWSTRTLGPGTYKRNPDGSDFVNQTGDMRLEFNIENRMKLTTMFEFAQFIDVGNIWTLKNYESQPGGQFKFHTFFKELAASYGLGLRLDLSFLLVRFDVGSQIYDPARDTGRFVMLKPTLDRMAFHFGIGYPF